MKDGCRRRSSSSSTPTCEDLIAAERERRDRIYEALRESGPHAAVERLRCEYCWSRRSGSAGAASSGWSRASSPPTLRAPEPSPCGCTCAASRCAPSTPGALTMAFDRGGEAAPPAAVTFVYARDEEGIRMALAGDVDEEQLLVPGHRGHAGGDLLPVRELTWLPSPWKGSASPTARRRCSPAQAPRWHGETVSRWPVPTAAARARCCAWPPASFPRTPAACACSAARGCATCRSPGPATTRPGPADGRPGAGACVHRPARGGGRGHGAGGAHGRRR